jgi:predicted dehydrogenase
MKKLRVAIAGAGIGRQHAAAFRKLPEWFDIVALCDPDPQRRESAASEFAIARTVAGFDELLNDRDADVVDICTPQSLHFAQAMAALDAGKHVICEKPVVGSLADCDRLIAAETASGKRVMPIFQYRFGAGLQKLLHLVARGAVGKHYLSTAETTWKRGPAYFATAWRGNLKLAMGGALLTQAIHAHDAITLALGPARKVYAATATRVNDVETEDCAAAALTFADGSLATFAVTLGAADDTSRLRYHFEHLTAQSSLAPYTMSAEPWTWIPTNDAAAKRIADGLADFRARPEGFVGQFERFHEAMSDGSELPVTLADARTSLELLTALYHSAKTGSAVDLPIRADHPAYRGWLS